MDPVKEYPLSRNVTDKVKGKRKTRKHPLAQNTFRVDYHIGKLRNSWTKLGKPMPSLSVCKEDSAFSHVSPNLSSFILLKET